MVGGGGGVDWVCYRLWVDGRLIDQECLRADASDVERTRVVNRQHELATNAETAGLSWVGEVADSRELPHYAYLRLGADGSALSGQVRVPYEATAELLIAHGHLVGPLSPAGADRVRLARLADEVVPKILGKINGIARIVGEIHVHQSYLTQVAVSARRWARWGVAGWVCLLGVIAAVLVHLRLG